MDRASVQERFGIIGKSAALMHVIDQVRLLSRTDASVLVQGESGVGKEVIARAIHEMGTRRHKKLVIVNCGAIPEGLIESELFGAEKGAYTGAVERRNGHFEEADQGTIFLDEIGEMPLQAQVRLLRVLETGEFNRVGSSTILKTDTRIIAATNKDLAREVQKGRFREDLYYRLSTVIVNIPALRERPDDVLPLFEHFLYQFSQRYDTQVKRLSRAAADLLVRYRWPGNVRELRNLAEQVVVLVQRAELDVDDVRQYMRGVSSSGLSNDLVVSSRKAGGENVFEDATEMGTRERELIYRALLELRNDIRELKDQVASATGASRDTKHRQDTRPGDFEQDERGGYVILGDSDRESYLPMVEDIPFEIEGNESRHGVHLPILHSKREEEKPEAEDPAFPTLEMAENKLIADALEYFNGNRRQTARALGISERTLYRKLKDLELEGDE